MKMKLNMHVKTSLIALGLLSLTACSTTGAGNNSLYGPNGSAGTLSTTGLGQQYGVQAINVPDSVLLTAPHNQSYYFDFDKRDVKTNYLASIKAQANYLIRHSNVRILVAGNTDARGSHEYNMALGERRALAVVSILEEEGVNKSQISYMSYGDMRPIALGHTAAAYAKNRRVDLTYKG